MYLLLWRIFFTTKLKVYQFLIYSLNSILYKLTSHIKHGSSQNRRFCINLVPTQPPKSSSKILIYLVGGASLTSIGLLVASRWVSEEFTSGILNFFTWPMMFLSEVWFSLEGSPNWVIYLSKLLPLTHINNAVRRVMIDGANLIDVSKELIVLVVITSVCLAVGSKLFSWNR